MFEPLDLLKNPFKHRELVHKNPITHFAGCLEPSDKKKSMIFLMIKKNLEYLLVLCEFRNLLRFVYLFSK